jgi:hypothetical protein
MQPLISPGREESHGSCRRAPVAEPGPAFVGVAPDPSPGGTRACYGRVTTYVPIRTCGHSCSTSLLYMRMQP